MPENISGSAYQQQFASGSQTRTSSYIYLMPHRHIDKEIQKLFAPDQMDRSD
jgi:hypothetical protein